MKNFIQLLMDNAGRTKQPTLLVRNEGQAPELYIYDVIDQYWGVNAKDVISAIAQVGKNETLHIRINSPGGSVFEARAIIEAIKRFEGKTIAHIDSVAASAATGIALAADEVEISEGGFFMIHNASAGAWGDKNAMREMADLLEKVEGSIVADYTGKTGKDEQEIVDLMNAETWFNAAEAIENGFVDRLAATAEKPKNTWNLASFDKAPQALLKAPEEKPVDKNPAMTVANANKLKLQMVV